MGAQASTTSPPPSPSPPPSATSPPPQSGAGDGTTKPKCKACCACPETKRARDDCIVQHGEENCKDLIAAHLKCMRDMGFNI